MTEDTFYTKHGEVIGTPHYMSPVQMSGEAQQDRKADIYSVGVILVELVAGQPPFLISPGESARSSPRG